MSGATLQFRAGLRRRPHKFLLCSIAICSALAARSVDGAWAADWPGAAPVLRGTVSPGYVRWDGWQAGIQAGFGNMNADFGNSTSSMVAFILRNSTLESEGHPSSWTTLPSNTTTGPVFGGFVGYNWQWSELVVGWDLAYKRPASLNSSASDSLRRLFDTSDSEPRSSLLTMRLCGEEPDMRLVSSCPMRSLAPRSGASITRRTSA